MKVLLCLYICISVYLSLFVNLTTQEHEIKLTTLHTSYIDNEPRIFIKVTGIRGVIGEILITSLKLVQRSLKTRTYKYSHTNVGVACAVQLRFEPSPDWPESLNNKAGIKGVSFFCSSCSQWTYFEFNSYFTKNPKTVVKAREVDRSWSSWGEWSGCSSVCPSAGLSHRYRSCPEANAACNASYCPGDRSERKDCLNRACNTHLNTSKTSDTTNPASTSTSKSSEATNLSSTTTSITSKTITSSSKSISIFTKTKPPSSTPFSKKVTLQASRSTTLKSNISIAKVHSTADMMRHLISGTPNTTASISEVHVKSIIDLSLTAFFTVGSAIAIVVFFLLIFIIIWCYCENQRLYKSIMKNKYEYFVFSTLRDYQNNPDIINEGGYSRSTLLSAEQILDHISEKDSDSHSSLFRRARQDFEDVSDLIFQNTENTPAVPVTNTEVENNPEVEQDENYINSLILDPRGQYTSLKRV